MKSRSFFSLLGIAVVLLLGVAAASFVWIVSNSPLALAKGGTTREPAGAIFVSKQAPLMVSLLVNPSELESLSRLIATPANRRKTGREIRDLEKSLLANTGLNYQREIQPWLGDEITLAVTSLDFDRNFTNGVKPGYLLAINTKDSARAREFLQASYSKQAVSGNFDLVFEPYKGVNLIYQRPLGSGGNNRFLASAVIGDTVLFANDIKVLREAVNTVQVPDLNLKNNLAYREALQTIARSRVGVVYANLPALSAWIAGAPVPETPEAVQRVATALTIKSRGLVAETALIGVAGAENRSPILSAPVGALSFIDEESLFVAASRDLHSFWRGIEEDLEPGSPLQQFITRGLDSLQEPLGVKLPVEVFSWVTGEYSLALVPSATGGEPDWIFVAERQDGVDVDGAIDRLDSLATAKGFTVGELPLFDTTVTAWTKLTTRSKDGKARLNTIVTGVHARVGNYEILTNSIEAMARALAPDKNLLTDSEKFQQAISALPTENDGYLYVDWREFQPVIESRFPIVQVLDFAVKPFFNNLRSLTVSSLGSENSARRGTVFFNLGVKSSG